MDRSVEIQLIEDLLGLQAQTSPFLDVQWHRESLERHYSPDIFRREQAQISARLPQIIAHGSALPEPNAYLTTEVAGRPVLLTRNEDGAVQAFQCLPPPRRKAGARA